MALAPLAAPLLPIVADATSTNTNHSSKSDMTALDIDNGVLAKKVAEAKALGIDITEGPTKTSVVGLDLSTTALNDARSDYKSQSDNLDQLIAKQTAKNATYKQETADYAAADKVHTDALAQIPDRDDGKKDGLTTAGGVSSIDGWKFMLQGQRDKVRESKAIVVSDGLSAREAQKHYLKKGTILSWGKDSKLVDAQGSNSSFDDGLIFPNGGSVKLTNVGQLADGTNINLVYKNVSGDNNSWSISPHEPGEDDNKAVGKIILNSQDDLNLTYQFVDDKGTPIELWTGNFFSDIDEPFPGYVQSVNLKDIQTNGIAVVAENVDTNGYTVVRKGGVFDNQDSDLSSVMTMTYGSGGHLRIYNAGSTKSNGYGEQNLRMITPMFGEELNIQIITKPIKPVMPKPEKATINYSQIIVPPKATKDVKLNETVGNNGSSINNQKVVKGQKITYSLGAEDLPASRTTDLTHLVYDDTLPDAVIYDKASAYSPDGKTDLSKYMTFKYDKSSRRFTASVSDEYLKQINSAKNSAMQLPVINLYTTASKDTDKFENRFTLNLNQYQVPSNSVTNTMPKITPHKQDLDNDGNDINGKAIKANKIVNYKMTWDFSDMKDIAISDDMLNKNSTFSDNYDKTKLDITAQTKQNLTVTDETTKNSVLSEVTVNWNEKEGKFVIHPNDPQAFLKAHAGNKLEIMFHPVVKSDASGTLVNTAIQNNFGSEYPTETVINNITLKPKAPATPNTSYGEKPKGMLYGAIAVIILIAGGVVFRKPLKNWLHK